MSLSDSKELNELRAASKRLIASDDRTIEKFCHSAADVSAFEDALQQCSTEHFQAAAPAALTVRLSVRASAEQETSQEMMKSILWQLLYNALTRNGCVKPFNQLSWSVDGYSMVARIARSILSNWCIDKKWIDDIDHEGYTVFMEAAKHGHVLIMELLLADPRVDKTSIDHADEDDWTALMLAAGRGHTSIVELLLADPRVDYTSIDHADEDGYTALMLAAGRGHTSIVELLLADPRVDKASIEHADEDGYTALMLAARYDYVPVVHLLISDSRTSWDSIVELTDHRRIDDMRHNEILPVIIAELTHRQMCVIYPSTNPSLWPVPVRADADVDAASGGPGDTGAKEDGIIAEPECALITSFFKSGVFDVNVLCIIREYATYTCSSTALDFDS
jgi:Ankyrin repeats (3 copies)/Ankyrin repeat